MLANGYQTPAWITQGNWRLGDKLGFGAFGTVYKGINDMGLLFAVKCLHTAGNSVEAEALVSEIDIMRNLERHDHIVSYLGYSFDAQKKIVNIFQEWMSGGSVAGLLEMWGPFPIAQIRNYTRQILDGLSFLHSKEIVHRDIKGANLLVDEIGRVKLADLGLSSRMQAGMTVNMTVLKGTPFFMAPEVLTAGKYGRKGDVWAVGCTVIQMMTGSPPWSHLNLLRDMPGIIQVMIF